MDNWDGGWYLNGWHNGDSFFVWALRLTLIKLDDMGMIQLKIGQRYSLKNLFFFDGESTNYGDR